MESWEPNTDASGQRRRSEWQRQGRGDQKVGGLEESDGVTAAKRELGGLHREYRVSQIGGLGAGLSPKEEQREVEGGVVLV